MEKQSSSRLTLQDTQIVETIAKLQRRISERFPDSGLQHLCGELLEVGRSASQRSQEIGRPIRRIRFASYLLLAGLIGSLVVLIFSIAQPATTELSSDDMKLPNLIAMADSSSQVMLLLSAGIYFLISLETRLKRRRALTAIHELRSMCHIIDMHQLTKDPERVLSNFRGTDNSPRQKMTPLELNRYLDYCSEMLSLTGKIAALYVKNFDDTASVAAVSEVEQLSSGLSRKIWQKIMILNQSIGIATPTRNPNPQ
ncbi:putative membrane associated protein [Rhodopirellula islandica]|uniref:Membrane associated protein n=1 Tax=Rhodopirellula islandica TaxID=595434 RepID=A0A0J1EAG6_RHOIS|nr:hypothetical protein [Rhodopirellula islandica]KLU02529.1 putative membrane associated protein [Rhodopirellula islandica]